MFCCLGSRLVHFVCISLCWVSRIISKAGACVGRTADFHWNTQQVVCVHFRRKAFLQDKGTISSRTVLRALALTNRQPVPNGRYLFQTRARTKHHNVYATNHGPNRGYYGKPFLFPITTISLYPASKPPTRETTTYRATTISGKPKAKENTRHRSIFVPNWRTNKQGKPPATTTDLFPPGKRKSRGSHQPPRQICSIP